MNVTCDIDPGNYEIIALYGGDMNYNPANVTKSVTVLEGNTFEKLQDLINGASTGETLILDNDYHGSGTPITIFKPLTIDGQGHTLDAGGLSHVFTVTANGVTLINLNLVNASSNSNGGAIYVTGIDFSIVDSSIINSSSTQNGGAIYLTRANGLINNLTIINSTSKLKGGAIYTEGDDTLINVSTFINNVALNEGGSIYSDGDNLLISKSVFNENYAGGNGGAIYLNGEMPTIIQSNFILNNAYESDGGAVYLTKENAQIKYSIFVSNAAANGGGIYGVNNTMVSYSNFSDNYVSNHGAAIYNCNYEFCSFEANTGESIIYFDEELRKNITMNVTVDDIMAGDILTVIIDVQDNISAPVGVKINDTLYNSFFTDGICLLNVYDLKGGNYVCCVIFDGTYEYLSCNVSGMFSVIKYNATMTVEASDISYGQDEEINILFGSNITGNLILSVGGNNYTVNIADGKAKQVISNLAAGTYVVTATFLGNDMYNAVVNTTSFTVSSKPDLSLVITVNTDEGYISITAPQDITGELALQIAGKKYILSKGNNRIDLTGLDSGNYGYTIIYSGDEKYNSYDAHDNITLTKNLPDISINASNVEYGQAENFSVRVPGDGSSQIEFTIVNGENSTIDNRTVPTVEGVAVYSIPNLNVGRYTLKAQYKGNSNYYGLLASSSFYVEPKITLSPEVTIGDDGVISMELGDVDGRIYVNVDNEEDGYKRISGGKFMYQLPTWDFDVGTHNISFRYSGDSFDENVFNYWDNQTASYKPIQYPFTIHIRESKSASNIGDDTVFTLILKDENGNEMPKATGNVTIEIIDQVTQEVKVFVVEVVNGIANLDISQYKDGNYLIRWSYSGDDKHTPISNSLNLKIAHKAARILASDITLQYTLSKSYSVTVYGSDGRGVNGETVSFLINGKVYKNVKTNSNGVASISISYTPGTHQLTIKSGSVSVTKKLTVLHILSLANAKVKKSAKKLVLKATLKKVNGKYLKGKKITFKFNGKKYTAKTNKKGVAKVTIKKNVLKKLKKGKKVKYQATYLKDTIKKTTKVKK